jgi:dihydroorotase
MYDLLLRGGTLVDPAHGIEAPRDLAVADGRVVAVEAAIDPAEAREVIDVSGLVVSPGIIDSHCHVGGTGTRTRAVGHRMVARPA